MIKAQMNPARLAAAAALLALMPPVAAAQEGMTDFAFDAIDPGFCAMPPPEVSETDLRGMLAEQEDTIPLVGTLDAPVEAGIFGDGVFARGMGRNAIAATIHAMIIPDEGEITALCLALVPVNDMDSTNGSVELHATESAPEAGDYYMVFARHMGRNDDGEPHQLAELDTGTGTLEFAQDMGEAIDGSLMLSGEMSDGSNLELAADFTIVEDEHTRFVDLTDE